MGTDSGRSQGVRSNLQNHIFTLWCIITGITGMAGDFSFFLFFGGGGDVEET